MIRSKNVCVSRYIILLLFLTLPIFALGNVESEADIPPFDSRDWLSGGFRQGDRTPFILNETRQIPVLVVHTVHCPLFAPHDRMFEMNKRWRSSCSVFLIFSPTRFQPQIDEMYPQNTFKRSFNSGWLWNDFSRIGLPRNFDRYNRVFNGLNW